MAVEHVLVERVGRRVERLCADWGGAGSWFGAGQEAESAGPGLINVLVRGQRNTLTLPLAG